MKRVILNEGVTHALRPVLEEHGFPTETVQYREWSGFPNHSWIPEASKAGYDVVVTTDGAIPAQQNLDKLGLGVVVLNDTNWTITPDKARRIVDAIRSVGPGDWIVADAKGT